MKVCAALLLIATAVSAADVSGVRAPIGTSNAIVEPESTINDADKTAAEIIDEYKIFKADWWKYVDLASGMTLGLYQPYVERARSYDCNS